MVDVKMTPLEKEILLHQFGAAIQTLEKAFR